MYVYVYKYTYSSPSSSHTYTHTRIRAVRLKRPEEIFWILTEGRESSEKSGAVTRQILSSEFPRGGLPLVYHDETRAILFSAYYTPAATDAYRLLHTHTHTHTYHTSPHTHVHSPTPMRRQWKTCMYKRAITRAYKSRNYNASRSERSCHSTVFSLPFEVLN